MTVLTALSIHQQGIITPFFARSVHKTTGLTWGAGPASYDVRVEFDSEGKVESMNLMPGDFVLASTIESFNMPCNVVGFAHDKSTWARRGLAVQNTLIDPGWRGHLTLELSNHGREVIYLARGDPIAQICFHYLEWAAARAYDGRYQDQERGPVKPR